MTLPPSILTAKRQGERSALANTLAARSATIVEDLFHETLRHGLPPDGALSALTHALSVALLRKAMLLSEPGAEEFNVDVVATVMRLCCKQAVKILRDTDFQKKEENGE